MTAVRRIVERSGPAPASGIAVGLRTVPTCSDQVADAHCELRGHTVVRAGLGPCELARVDRELVRTTRAELPREQLERAPPRIRPVSLRELDLRERVLERRQRSCSA